MSAAVEENINIGKAPRKSGEDRIGFKVSYNKARHAKDEFFRDCMAPMSRLSTMPHNASSYSGS
jgi:hypothetical protein